MVADLRWIVGPERAAVRRRKSRVYSLGSKPDELSRVPMGLHLSLARADADLAAEPAATRSLVRVGLPTLRLSQSMAWVLVLSWVAASAAGAALGRTGPLAAPAQYIVEWSELLWLLVGVALGSTSAACWEAGVVGSQLVQGRGWFGLGWLGPTVEPVVWRLGIPADCAWLSLLGPVFGGCACLAWSESWPALGSGLTIGALAYALRVSLPLRPGAGTRVLETLLGTPDLSRGLRWALATRFLPAGQRIATGGGSAMAVGGVGLALWIAAVGVVLRALASRGAAGTTAAGMTWDAMVSVAGIVVTLWLAWLLVSLYRSALHLRGRAELRPTAPSDEVVRDWTAGSALTTHVPFLATASWRWHLAPTGTYLIRFGERDRTFYWLASGAARVLARDAAGDVVHVATLHQGAGVGEIAFLDDRPRTADVLITRTALVAALSFEDFDTAISAEDREQVRGVVLAGQALARARVFQGIPPAEKERWLRMGVPKRYAAGEVVIAQGDTDRWMGLVVQGNIEVCREGDTVAELHSGRVFGEIAFLFAAQRSATLRAQTDALVWSWEPGWLDEEVDRTGLRPALQALAESRGVP
jgi:CRP-like cAMP-binding protein